MVNVELVIKVPEDLYEAYKGRPPMLGDAGMDMIAQAISKGVPLPKGHGRLGDLSKIYVKLNDAQVEGTDEYKGLGEAKQIVCDTPTIIEADKEE